jgi:hypothetical protein
MPVLSDLCCFHYSSTRRKGKRKTEDNTSIAKRRFAAFSAVVPVLNPAVPLREG